MWFLFSLLAMICWSGSDLFSKMGSEQKDRYSHYKMGIAVGLVFGLHAIYMLTFGGVDLTFRDIVMYLPASALYIISMIIGYVGLRYIELSISSPICNSSGVVALLLGMAVYGIAWNDGGDSDKIVMNIPTVIAVILIAVGIISIGFVDAHEDAEIRELRQSASNRKYSKSFIAILLPILYCIIDSLGTFIDDYIAGNYTESLMDTGLDEELAASLCGDRLNTAYELTWFFMAIIFAVYIFGIKREKAFTAPNGIKCVGGICETVGQVFYMMVIVNPNPNSVIGLVIISSYCVLSFVWSHLFLKEKLSYKHYISIAAVFAGILILGILDPG